MRLRDLGWMGLKGSVLVRLAGIGNLTRWGLSTWTLVEGLPSALARKRIWMGLNRVGLLLAQLRNWRVV